MKKGLKIGLCALVVAGVAVGIFLYLNPKKALNVILPEADSISDLAVNLSGDTAYIGIKVHVKNKSLFKLSMDSLIYHARLDTASLLCKSQFLNTKLKPSQSDTVYLPIALPYKRLSNTIKSLQGKDSVDIQLDLKLVYATILGETTLPFKKVIRIEVPRQPKFEILKVEFLKREKKKGFFRVDIQMHNYGKIDLKVSDLNYNMTAEDLFIARGTHPEQMVIKPRSDMVFHLPVTVEFKKMFKTLSKIATNNDKVNYTLKVTAFLQNDRVSDEKTPLRIDKNGILELKK